MRAVLSARGGRSMIAIGLLLLICVLLPRAAPGLGQSLQQENRAGLVLRFAENDVRTRCIDLGPDGELTGEELLNASGFAIGVEFDPGAGAAVCKIAETGCDVPQESCFCECTLEPDSECVYWSYYQLQGAQWQVSNLGASSTSVRPGSVDGWSWSAGQIGAGGIAPPVIAFDEICEAGNGPAPTNTLPPPAQLLPTFTPTVDPRFATATFSPTATATASATASPTATASRTPAPTATATALIPTPTVTAVTPTVTAVVPTATAVTPTAGTPTVTVESGGDRVARVPTSTAGAPATGAATASSTVSRAGDTSPAAAAPTGTPVMLIPVVGNSEPATPTVLLAVVQDPEGLAATSVTTAPVVLPTAGPAAARSAESGGSSNAYVLFFLLVIGLAIVIVFLNFRRSS